MKKRIGKKVSILSLLILTSLIIPTLFSNPVFSEDSRSGQLSVKAKNLSLNRQAYELSPQFVLNDSKIVFLTSDGNEDYEMEYSYTLAMMNLDGSDLEYVSENEVLDFIVEDNDVLVLLENVIANYSGMTLMNFSESEGDNYEWQIRKLNLRTEDQMELISGKGRDLSVGYELLDTSRKRDLSANLIRKGNLHYYQVFKSNKMLWETEVYRTYTDELWIPAMIHENDRQLLLLEYGSFENERFPQSEGIFSIVRVDKESGTREALISHPFINPFPKFCLDEKGSILYYQKKIGAISELWKLDLITKTSEFVYAVAGTIGYPSISKDGTKLIYNQHVDSEIDIMHLEIEKDLHVTQLINEN